jgi:hypothetical protein
MKMGLFTVTLFSILSLVKPHSWVNWLKCVDTGEIGYIREYQGRDQIQDFDIYMTYLIEGRNLNTNVCSVYQREDIYYPEYPKLSCPAGSIIQFEYNTNGHVITDQCLPGDPRGCKDNGNTADTFWAIFMNNQVYPNQLTTVGDVNTNPAFNDDSGLINDIVKGQKFDFNGVCGDISSQACVGEFKLPTDVVTDRDYQFVWYWQIDRNYQATGEVYTSCWDVYITSSSTPTVTPVTPIPTPCIHPTPTPTHANCITNDNP